METLIFPKNGAREQVYEVLYPQVRALIEAENDPIANFANFCAALKQAFGFFWIGVYLKKGNELVLGPFQGPIACTRIAFHRGVCGHAYTVGKSIVVPDVEQFPGHIACNSASKSEVVVPLKDANGAIYGVLDVDSDKLDDFSDIDAYWLEKFVALLK